MLVWVFVRGGDTGEEADLFISPVLCRDVRKVVEIVASVIGENVCGVRIGH